MAEIRSTETQSRGTFAVTRHMIIRSLIIADPCGSTPLPCSRLKSTLRATHGARCTAVMHHINSKLPKLHQRPFGVYYSFLGQSTGQVQQKHPLRVFPAPILPVYYKYNPVLLQSYSYYILMNKLYRRGVSAC